MAETVNQSLSVTPAASETPSIVLDGDLAQVSAGAGGLHGALELAHADGSVRARLSASDGRLVLRSAGGDTGVEASANGNLTLGGPAGDGDLYVKDSSGVTRIELDGQNQLLRFRNASAQDVGLVGSNGDITMGGNGSNADIVLKDASGATRVSLSASAQRVRVQAADGGTLADLGPNGNLTLGGAGGADGDLYLRDAAGVTRLELDAQNHLLRIRNASNQEVGRLGDNANLRLGGNGSDGDIVLSDSSGTTRLELDADNQLLRIRNRSGLEVGSLGPNANLVLGGNGSDGDVDLYDGSGRRRILLNADGQSLSTYDAAGNQVFNLSSSSNLRLGGHGTDGDVLLYPSGASDIFSDADATIHLNADAGDITLRNADCAEEFEVLPSVNAEPGTVMALSDDGRLQPSAQAHQRSVVGVVSGAGSYAPAIVLDKQRGRGHRRPIALMGKTFVKVTDEAGPIAIGDLLTTSSTEGHAMRAADPLLAFGAVIGKAIAPHRGGTGLIPMVIALQ
jgi:hypothetical protein